MHYNSGKLPDTAAYCSPRMGFNWDVAKDGTTQVRGGTGLFTGKPPFVWISNQIGNTGVLYGFLSSGATTAFGFNPDPDRYKPAPTGTAASSYELNVTDPGFRFPQTWRTNIGIDRRLPWNLIATGDFIYNNDVNGPVYINANLPAAESAFTGVDNRPRWVANAAYPACITSGGPFGTGGQAGPCVTRLNNAVGNSVTAAYVIKNQSQTHSWNIAATLSKTLSHGFSARGRIQLWRREEHGRALVYGRQFVGVGKPDRARRKQSAPGLLTELAGRAGLPSGDVFRAILFVRQDHDLRVL